MPLSDTAIRSAKPRESSYKLTDAQGLYLLAQPAGGKWWRLDYRFGGKRKTLSMGIYPDIFGNDETQYLPHFPGSRWGLSKERVSIGNAHLTRLD